LHCKLVGCCAVTLRCNIPLLKSSYLPSLTPKGCKVLLKPYSAKCPLRGGTEAQQALHPSAFPPKAHILGLSVPSGNAQWISEGLQLEIQALDTPTKPQGTKAKGQDYRHVSRNSQRGRTVIIWEAFLACSISLHCGLNGQWESHPLC